MTIDRRNLVTQFHLQVVHPGNAKWTEPQFECKSTGTQFDNLLSGAQFTYPFSGTLQMGRNMAIVGHNLVSSVSICIP